MFYTLKRTNRLLPTFSESLNLLKIGNNLSHDHIVSILQTQNPEEIQQIHDAAGQKTQEIFGNEISLRGIVEFSNHCEKSCHYCGVPTIEEKYLISHESILECCDFMWEKGYKNIVLQSGEITSELRMSWLSKLISKIFSKFGKDKDNGMCIILSVGELSYKQYKHFYDLGVQRFLLRIESSNPKLYASMHPKDNNHLWQTRIDCLTNLQNIGYVTGTGMMVGIPNQTYDDIASDIEFFRDGYYPMIGLGPYIIHSDTVMGKKLLNITSKDERNIIDQEKVNTTLLIYDTLRLISPLINIAATTALETLSPGSKAKALTGGANVLMPIITPKSFRIGYQIYEGKKEIDLDREETHQRVLDLMKQINKTARFDRWNDPPLFEKMCRTCSRPKVKK